MLESWAYTEDSVDNFLQKIMTVTKIPHREYCWLGQMSLDAIPIYLMKPA